ncbi:response regulator transcription factor [Sulfurospirillum arcachonense]|uniref:response regulator transcription factor n=1 Tax=Sulfurospirillum arcachonense TaxID=57666 RepID=UPI00046A1DDB|nr:response regulator transcription factor [Sulfurospirillum arcachonense]
MSVKPSKILFLEDDVNLNETVTEFLQENGYVVDSVYDGDEAEVKMYENSYDLFLLDVNVPGLNGFELLKNSRENENKTPAIFLTSLNSIDDVSVGYESGCDDYIRKPFELKEILLRVKTLIKREFFHSKDDSVKIAKDIEYHTSTNSLHVEGKEVQLQNKEAILLKLFLQRRGEIISHKVILEELWGYDEVASDDALRTYIKNLRKIIGKERIISVKKLGYKFITE